MPKESAFIIYLDPNTPRHLVHSIIDLTSNLMQVFSINEPNLYAYV